MAQHISAEKGSNKLLPLHNTHHLSPSDRTQGPLATLQKLADESSAVQRVNALQDMANAQYPVQREVDEDEDALVRQDKTAQNSAPIQRHESTQGANGLPQDLRSGIENLSGISMDDVTVQRNSSEPAKVGAHAFAQGTNIHLGPGQDKHLPHEAWHVVQQKQGRVKPTMQMKGVAINDDVGLEREADVMGARAARTSGHLQGGNTSNEPVKQMRFATPIVQRLLGAAQQPGTEHTLPNVAGNRGEAAKNIANFINERARRTPAGLEKSSVLAANNPGNIYVRSRYTVNGNPARLETWSEMSDVGGGYVKRVRITENGVQLMDRVMNDVAPTALNAALQADAGGGGLHQYPPMHGADPGDTAALTISDGDHRSADNITKVVGEGARFGWLANGLSNNQYGNGSTGVFNVAITIPQAGRLSMNPTFQELWGAWRSGFGRSYLKDKSAAKSLLQARLRERLRPAHDGDVVVAGSIAHGGQAGGQVTSLLSTSGQIMCVPITVNGVSGATILSDFSMTWTADH